jgi:hypothetical protein
MLNNQKFDETMRDILDKKGFVRPPPPPPIPQSDEPDPEPNPSEIIIPKPLLPLPSFSFDTNRPASKPSLSKTNIYQKYEISKEMALRLETLNDFKIVFVFDDSSSMTTKDYHLGAITRWDELLKFAKISIEFATLFNPNGCDIYFFNRATYRNIKDHTQLEHIFSTEPFGSTMITYTLQSVFNDHLNKLNGKKLLILIATDGEPTDIMGQVRIDDFQQFLSNRPNNVYTTIVACTDDLNSIGYLNGLDKSLKRFDVVRDYKNEFEEVRKANGLNFKFSYSDYITKSLIGSIDDYLGNIDGF